MASGVAFIQWSSYCAGLSGRGLFADEPLTFNSHQERLHALAPGDDLWLASRCPDDQQYYFVGVFCVSGLARNAAGSAGAEYGAYSVIAHRSRSHDLGRRFPAEGLLRALQFDTRHPIRHGASIGQSLQALRLLAPPDVLLLKSALRRLAAAEQTLLDSPFGLWTKCEAVFADYFWSNWTERRQPLAFLLYDSPPVIPSGAPVFIHSDGHLRLIARFREAEYVAGHKHSVDVDERIAERERIWSTYRAATLNRPEKREFDDFWEQQDGVRALFLMDGLSLVSNPPRFKVYGRAMEWGFPRGVGHRYLSLSQVALLLRACQLPDELSASYLAALL